MPRRIQYIAILFSLFTMAHGTHAQWRTQSITLREGWNAVHIAVSPALSDCDTIFAGLPIESAWLFSKRFTTYEFEENPRILLAEPDHWRVWYPASNPASIANTLGTLQGGNAYLIKATNACSLTLKGTVKLPEIAWFPGFMNFVGFPVAAGNAPNFEQYFAPCEEIDMAVGVRGTLFVLQANGANLDIRQTAWENIQPGVAYWVKCMHPTDYVAPIDVAVNGGSALDFDELILTRDLTIRNESSDESVGVALSLMSSEAPPTGFPELGGDVPLSYFFVSDSDPANFGWTNLPAVLSKTLAPDEMWNLRLAVRRSDMAPAGTGAVYQSVLRVSDDAGSLDIMVPVTAKNSSATNLPSQRSNAGLWVGEAVLDSVNRPAIGTNVYWNTAEPMPTATPFSFRLIIHADADGGVQLLQRALVSWYDPPGSNYPPHYAIWTDERLIPANAKQVYRTSTVGFGPEPTPMVGAFGDNLTATNVLGCDASINPFRHSYHPDHDNLDAEYSATTLGHGKESFTVQRVISLAFADYVPSGNPFAGQESASGTYEETISGLRQTDIKVKGSFSLQRINKTEWLNW